MKYRKYIERVDEGFFKDIYGMTKVIMKLKELSKTSEKIDFKNEESMIKGINDKIASAKSIIASAKISDDLKDSMYGGFLGGVFGMLYKKLDKSGNDLQKMFGWDQKTLNTMLNYHHK
jgi:hypothetical protein